MARLQEVWAAAGACTIKQLWVVAQCGRGGAPSSECWLGNRLASWLPAKLAAANSAAASRS